MIAGEYRTLYHNATESVRPSGVQWSFITSVRQDSGAGRVGTSPANLAQVSTEYPGGRSPPLLSTPSFSESYNWICSDFRSLLHFTHLLSARKVSAAITAFTLRAPRFLLLTAASASERRFRFVVVEDEWLLFVCWSSTRSCTFSPGWLSLGSSFWLRGLSPPHKWTPPNSLFSPSRELARYPACNPESLSGPETSSQYPENGV